MHLWYLYLPCNSYQAVTGKALLASIVRAQRPLAHDPTLSFASLQIIRSGLYFALAFHTCKVVVSGMSIRTGSYLGIVCSNQQPTW